MQDELPLESRLKYTHHQLSRRLSEKEVFAFSLAAANRVSPPLCLRPIPPFPRYPDSQWEAEKVPSVGQSVSSCYVGGRIDKGGIFFPLLFFTSSHYSWRIGWRQETLLPAKHHVGYRLNRPAPRLYSLLPRRKAGQCIYVLCISLSIHDDDFVYYLRIYAHISFLLHTE